ncbi:MAG: DUF3301 domain-containing protein [Hydrogenophilaceae bacterium]|nr:DUF3301 domain-containing protein [Hydrogenophilaceae bacterium]
MSGEWLAVGVLCAVGWLWWDGLQKRELAITAARAVCARAGVQLLDETVALRRLRLRRDDRQQARLYREFAFEYAATGDERLPGRVYLLGSQILMAHLIEPI